MSKPFLTVADFEGHGCLCLDLDKDDDVFYCLYYINNTEEGFYAYSNDMNKIRALRMELVKGGNFIANQLTIKSIVNYCALRRKRCK